MKLLKPGAFCEFFPSYLESHPLTQEVLDFESMIEAQAYEYLVANWSNGWDFDTQAGYFGGRGASILIENAAIDWRPFWGELVRKSEAIPDGALVNFEVWDNIRGKAKVGGSQIVRRIITTEGVFEEAAV